MGGKIPVEWGICPRKGSIKNCPPAPNERVKMLILSAIKKKFPRTIIPPSDGQSSESIWEEKGAGNWSHHEGFVA